MSAKDSKSKLSLKDSSFLKNPPIEEKPEDNSNLLPSDIAWKIALGMIIIAVIVFASQFGPFLFSRLTNTQVAYNTPIQITRSALQIAVNSTMFFGNSTYQNKIDFESCDASGNCTPTFNATDRSYAWRIFGELGLYQRTHSPIYLNQMKSDFSSILQGNYSWGAPFYSSYQIGRTYLVINYTPMLDYYYTTNRDALNAQPGDLSPGNPMLEATLAREYALTALMLNQSNSVDYLESKQYVLSNSSSPLSANNQRAAFLDASEYELNQSIQDASSEPLVISDMPDFKQDECWIISAKYDLYRATGNKSYLSDVLSFFNRAHFGSRNPSELNVQLPSQIHPCIDVLEQIAAPNNSYSYDADFLLQDYVVRSWDSPASPICNGDGGFLSVVPQDPTAPVSCIYQYKSDSDAGYSIYLLANDNNTAYRLIGD